MALTVSRKEVHKVQVPMDGGEFTASIRTMKHREASRAALLFSRLARKLEALGKLIPAAPVADGETVKRIALTELTEEQQDAVLNLSADLTDDLVETCAHGLCAVEGIEEDGEPLAVPSTLEGRRDFVDTYFGFTQQLVIASETISHNTVTEKDAGN
jgi:hypothetical protein